MKLSITIPFLPAVAAAIAAPIASTSPSASVEVFTEHREMLPPRTWRIIHTELVSATTSAEDFTTTQAPSITERDAAGDMKPIPTGFITIVATKGVYPNDLLPDVEIADGRSARPMPREEPEDWCSSDLILKCGMAWEECVVKTWTGSGIDRTRYINLMCPWDKCTWVTKKICG